MPLTEKRPRGLLRLALRAPLLLYRVRLSWLLGERFLLLVHQGRTTGLRHETLLEVAYRDAQTGEVVVIAAWGKFAAWYRNLQAAPAIEVRIGHERWPISQPSLSRRARARRRSSALPEGTSTRSPSHRDHPRMAPARTSSQARALTQDRPRGSVQPAMIGPRDGERTSYSTHLQSPQSAVRLARSHVGAG